MTRTEFLKTLNKEGHIKKEVMCTIIMEHCTDQIIHKAINRGWINTDYANKLFKLAV